MGRFSEELIDVTDRSVGLDGDLGPDAYDGHRANADRLVALLNERRAHAPVVLYFPSGRYLIGRPSTPMGEVFHNPDIFFPAFITLKFASGAQLVPMGYAGMDEASVPDAPTWCERSIPGLQQSERFKVRIVIQGCVEAGIHPIFDAFVHEDLDDSHFQEAGRILFQGNATPAIYPEWWNSVPLVNEEIPSEARVRRTTVALQMALDAAHNRRVSSFRGDPHALPSIPVMLVNDYAIDRPLRIGATLAQARDEDKPDVDAPANYNGVVLRGGCGPATRRFGAALIKASGRFIPDRAPDNPGAEVSTMLAMRTSVGVTVQNLVLDADERAERCVTVSLGQGTMASHHNGFEGCEFRNARRTLVHIGGEIALAQKDPMDLNHRQAVAPVDNPARRGDLDLSGLRFERCRFETGTKDRVDLAARLSAMPSGVRDELPITEEERNRAVPGYWRVGVMFRAKESLPIEFHGCIFVGPANPMILGLGGRMSLQNCAFRTDRVESPNGPGMTPEANLRQWNGTDILCALALMEMRLSTLMASSGSSYQPIGATSLTARNVESRSRQFLATFEAPLFAAASIYCSVTLIHLRHRSDFSLTDEDRERPAIYWGGPRVNNNTALVMMSCVFGDRVGKSIASGGVYVSSRENSPLAPVLDLGARRVRGGEVIVSPISSSMPVPNILRLGATAGSTARRG